MAKRIPWPELDIDEFYENETSYLKTLVEGWTEEQSWANIAKCLNEQFHNNRTPQQCKYKADKHDF